MAGPLLAACRAAAYGRISEDDQDEREGVDEQLARAEVHIERRGWDLMASFRDDDLSAYSGKPRPGYDALMGEVQAGRVDAIVLRHLDRLWRDDLEAAKGRAAASTPRPHRRVRIVVRPTRSTVAASSGVSNRAVMTTRSGKRC